jgi:hypothetical protein
MLFNPETHGEIARDRIEREIAQARLLREAREARQPALSIRQAIGRRIIAIGARLAAEPPFESSRSR